MESRMKEKHFEAVVIEAGNWFFWQKGQRTAGTEKRVHYLPTSALATRFVQETALNERRTKEDIDWITDWLAKNPSRTHKIPLYP